ncbi:MAG: hypothetical protein V4721_10595 [Bacteroidota bacterium]
MGIGIFRSSASSHDKKSSSIFSNLKEEGNNTRYAESVYPSVIPLPNPDPNNYQIIKSTAMCQYLIVDIKYLDCVNYEGRKILVFENCSMNALKKQKLIDPHFSENKKYFSPIARFEPTETGWRNAIIFTTASAASPQ